MGIIGGNNFRIIIEKQHKTVVYSFSGPIAILYNFCICFGLNTQLDFGQVLIPVSLQFNILLLSSSISKQPSELRKCSRSKNQFFIHSSVTDALALDITFAFLF